MTTDDRLAELFRDAMSAVDELMREYEEPPNVENRRNILNNLDDCESYLKRAARAAGFDPTELRKVNL